MHIIQISDSHISRDHPGRASELAACVAYINSLDLQPDVVVHTGDIAHDGLTEEYILARRLLDELAAPYVVLAGNRDNRARLVESFCDGHHLCTGMDFVQYAVEDFPVRLIIVDTVSTASHKGRLCERRLADIDSMLSRDTSRPALMFLHHPPFDVPVAPDPFQFESRNEAGALLAAVARYPNVRGLHCGHVHRGYETTIGALEATVLSCLTSDLRWDTPDAVARGLPVLRAHIVHDVGNAHARSEEAP